jgi:hypothetical protein
MVFALGSPPQTSSGPVGIARVAASNNPSTSQANTGGAIPARFYEPPCTADHTRLP